MPRFNWRARTKALPAASGTMLMFAMVFGAIGFSFIVLGVAGYPVAENRAANFKANREKAFQIAEAGLNYYRWHLAHDKNDYQDGTNAPGPYQHAYLDDAGNTVGYFSLNITPPASGATVVTVESTGWTALQPGSRRVLRARLAFPAFTDYSYLTNASVIVDANTVIRGKFHSNGGIQFDGATDAPVTSAVSSYTCKKENNRGCDVKGRQNGIWGQGGPQSFWRFPVPAVDINAVAPKVKQIKDEAKTGGIYLSSSGEQGWWLEFKSNGTINAYKVLSAKCYKGKKEIQNQGHEWFCTDRQSVGAPEVRAMPPNGFIYVNDRVWVSGVVKGRATVAVKKDRSIIIDDNLTYLNKDGAHALGLIADQDIIISHDAPDTLEINAVLLSFKGAAEHPYYEGLTKTKLSIYGSVIAFKNWYWNWVDNKGKIVSGFKSAELTYDANLVYNPPPGFPFGADYQVVGWEEVR